MQTLESLARSIYTLPSKKYFQGEVIFRLEMCLYRKATLFALLHKDPARHAGQRKWWGSRRFLAGALALILAMFAREHSGFAAYPR